MPRVLMLPLLLLATAADARPHVEGATEREDIRFWMDAEDVSRPSCGGCARATWIHIGRYKLKLFAPEGLDFERFVLEGDGRVALDGVSPNGRTVHAVLHPGRAPGDHRVTAVFRDKRGARFTTTKTFSVDDPRARRGHDCEPSPCSTPGPDRDRAHLIPKDQAPPRGPCRLRARGPLRFSSAPNGVVGVGGWPQRLLFFVALKETERGDLSPPVDGGPGNRPTPPSVQCTLGQLAKIDVVDALPGDRDRYRVEVTTLPADDPGRRLVAGWHRCTVTYQLHQGERVRERSGSLAYRIDSDGYLSTKKPRCPPPPKRAKQRGAKLPAPPRPPDLHR